MIGIRDRWAAGDVTLGAWLSIPSSVSAEAAARQGFDYVCVDTQHGAVEYQTTVAMIQGIELAGGTPLARVPWNEPGIIGKMLDAGAHGVIVPMVNTVADAEAVVRACRYAPIGSRSYGPTMAAMRYPDYPAWAEANIAVIPMIETVEAMQNLDAILAVPGIDAIYVGPADLSITLGQQPRMDNEGAFEAARIKIAETCRRHGVVPGIHANAGLAAKHAAAGYQMITITGDAAAMSAGAAADLKLARAAAPKGQPVY